MDLPPESIPADGDIHQPEQGLATLGRPFRQHDETGACPEDGTLSGKGPEGSDQPELPHEPAHGRALTPGDDETVDAGKMGLEPYLDGMGPKPSQHLHVFSKRSLQGEHTYGESRLLRG